MASSGTGLLVFIEYVTEDRSSQMNSEVHRDIGSAQIQTTQKATQEFLKVKKWNIRQWPSQSPDLNTIEQHFTC